MSVYLAVGAALAAAMFLLVLRAVLGPSVYDRILAMNALGTKTVLFIALLGFLQGRPDFVDVALVYALVNFVSTLAILRMVEQARLS